MTIRPVNVTFKEKIDLDILKDDIFDAINDHLIENYKINDPENDIENYDAFIIDALIHSIKHFYPDDAVVTVDYD